jgi:type IV pilus assembly protein PilP
MNMERHQKIISLREAKKIVGCCSFFTLKRLCYAIKLFILSTIVLVLSGCAGDNQDLHRKFEEVRSRPGGPIQEIPEFKSTPMFTYPSHLKRRNPFFPYQEQVKQAEQADSERNAPNMNRTKQELENYKLKDIRMVGSLKQNGTIWALIETPDERLHKLTIGSYVGEDYGRVISITEQKIRLIETYKDKSRWQKRNAVIDLDSTNAKTVSGAEHQAEQTVK